MTTDPAPTPVPYGWAIKAGIFAFWPLISVLFVFLVAGFSVVAWALIPFATVTNKNGKIDFAFLWSADDGGGHQ
jgi:hypothetical protein